MSVSERRVAAAILGIIAAPDHIDAPLSEVELAERRLELVALFTEEGRFDFEAAERAWGADEESARSGGAQP